VADRVNADGLPRPSHTASDAYLLRQCQLLDQISRQLDDLLAQGQAPVVNISQPSTTVHGPDFVFDAAPVELVTEPAEPKPPVKKAAPKAAKKAAPKNA
jgi:hypothetical protein